MFLFAAIKTGRYSYVKKSHDIIEMIEHHFQHFVKRKQCGNYKSSPEIIDDAIDISAKKFRSSCALEEISEAFRKPGREFMELSPTKSSFSSQTAFNFDDSNITNDTVFPVSEINSLINPEKPEIDVVKNIPVKNEATGADTRTMDALPDANGYYPGWCPEIRDSEFAHYFNSPSTKPCQASPTCSPVSSSSPLSDVSNSIGSSSSISPSWLEFPNFSDSLYTVTSPEDNSSFLAYSDTAYGTGFESYNQQQRWNESAYFNNNERTIKDDRAHIKQNFFNNQTNCPFQSYTADRFYDSSINSPEYNPYSKNQMPAQNTEFLHLHTPVSNELEQLRRLSWDDLSFGDDFLCPVSGFVTDTSRTLTKNTPTSDIEASACVHSTINNVTRDKAGNPESVFPESSISSYWDLDATTPKTKDAYFNTTTDHHKEHFPFISDMDQSCTPYNPSVIRGSYYRERQGSDSSIGSSTVEETRHSLDIPTSEHAAFEYTTQLFNCPEALTDVGISKEKPMKVSGNSCALSELLNKKSLSLSPTSPLVSTSDLDKALKKDPVIISGSSHTLPLEQSNEPLNFLNIPHESRTPVDRARKLIKNSVLDSMKLSVDSDDYSPESTDDLSKQASELSCDDAHLEKWTPFSLGGETPRVIEQDGKQEDRMRLHENDDDYHNKSLPWCEFTEAELDEVVLSLKTAYQKHVVIDSHLLSDEEMAEKLKSFLVSHILIYLPG